MVINLTANWRQVESSYMDFCLDFFDEKPIVLSRLDAHSRSQEILCETELSFHAFFEGFFIVVLRFIFVKKHALAETIKKTKQRSKKRIQLFVSWRKISDDFVNSLVRPGALVGVPTSLGFT